MNIISIEFLVFIALTYIGCLVLPQRVRWVVLLIASVIFYAFSSIPALVVMLFFSLLSFCSGLLIERIQSESKKKKIILIISVVVVVSWLVFTKMLIALGLTNAGFVIPLGVSYVSFSLISYLADIYWGRDTADKNPLKHILYVLFFPKISQGPITRHKKLAQSLYNGENMSYEGLSFGIQRMLYGYFKKVVIADRIAIVTGKMFSSVYDYSGSMLAAATILAALELYCDFSGYMDIILGFSETLGFQLDENFKHPFFAKTAAEFWRRWHITLGSWFKDYIYTPIVMSRSVKKLGKAVKKAWGKKVGNNIMKVIALTAVWLLTGLWHGTGVNYILWGCMWGTVIILPLLFEDVFITINSVLRISTDSFLWKLFQMLRTSAIFCLGVLITRVPSLFELRLVLSKIVKSPMISDRFRGYIFDQGVNKPEFILMIIGLLIVLCVSIAQERVSVRKAIASLYAPLRWIIYAVSITIILLFGIYGAEYTTSGFAYTFF
jgi:D-alanyl-lipoteichoic acid acyltransferase DltB (MBOAT superfamily)